MRGRLWHNARRSFKLLQREIRADHMRVALNTHGQAIAQLDLRDMLAFLVHQIVTDSNWTAHKHFA